MTTDQAIEAAIHTGYRRSPNNIYHLPGAEYSPGKPGIPEARPFLVFIGDQANATGTTGMEQDTWPVGLYTNLYGKPCTLALVKRFRVWDDYLRYAEEYHHPSKPGMPAFMFGD